MSSDKTVWKIRFFKTKIYFSNKQSDLRYNLKKVKESKFLKNFSFKIGGLIDYWIKNMRENAENWNDRLNVDRGFFIDS
jgi:hypothetical protein